jgi:hypothetical protein
MVLAEVRSEVSHGIAGALVEPLKVADGVAPTKPVRSYGQRMEGLAL